MNQSHPPVCWRCGYSPSDYSHIFWSCPAITSFWSAVITMINTFISMLVHQAIEICLLGLVDNILHTRADKTLAGLLLFYARKAITLQWKKQTPPTTSFWKQLINKNHPLYKDTYANRGCLAKYDKVWAKWLSDPKTASKFVDSEGSGDAQMDLGQFWVACGEIGKSSSFLVSFYCYLIVNVSLSHHCPLDVAPANCFLYFVPSMTDPCVGNIQIFKYSLFGSICCVCL